MAVNEIGHITPVLNTEPRARERAAAAQDPAITPAQQAALLINQVLQDLKFVNPVDSTSLQGVGLNPLLTVIEANQGLTPAQQVALGVNESLQDIASQQRGGVEALLIDETPPLVETLEVAQTLTVEQQAAVQVNEALQELRGQGSTLTMTEIAAGAVEGEAQELRVAPATVTPAAALQAALSPTPTIVASQSPTTAVSTTAATTTLAPQVAAPVPEAAIVPQNQNVLPSTAISPRDPTPFAYAVYEIRNPHPAPGDPKPVKRELSPLLPPGRVRPVDRLILKREWEKRGEEGQRQHEENREAVQETVQESMSLPEKSIHQVVTQANEDLSSRGIPLRLVLAKNSDGYALDIYNCSEPDQCRMEQEVPLNLSELSSLLDSIQHESGIIINIKT